MFITTLTWQLLPQRRAWETQARPFRIFVAANSLTSRTLRYLVTIGALRASCTVGWEILTRGDAVKRFTPRRFSPTSVNLSRKRLIEKQVRYLRRLELRLCPTPKYSIEPCVG